MPDPAYRVARRVARDLAAEQGLTPPFDVERVARSVAEVIDEDIPTHADVIVLHADAPGARPRIVVHESLHGSPERRRFALAHGIGHVLLGWHPLGSPCDVSARPHELPVTPYDLVEGEASAFARELLVPEAWIRSFDGLDRPAVLIRHVAERAGVGLMPAARAVALLLPPGHVWVVTDSWDRVLDAGRSPGTNVCAPHMGDELDTGRYARPASARHRDEHAGCAINVWYYDPAAIVALPHDSTATEVAQRIGSDLGLGEDGTRTLVARVDGIAGWANEQLGTASLQGMTRVLDERARTLPELADATAHPAFGELLAAKATELVAKRLAR
ncbi:MAG: putative Zn peptidase [Thermoleophilia bacterium]|nr:putative Zn peptidase [Thermoleophilia bacterium]